MQTCLLFLPFPYSQGSTNDVNAFNQLFQGEAAKMMELARSTKMKGAPSSSFRSYIRGLSTRRGAQIQAVWTDPFNPSNSIQSRAIETEIAATIWNYIATIHNIILKTDSSNVQSLKEIKNHLEEINACNIAFEEILGIIQHPIFTPALAHFMKLYNNYISSYWQLSCIISLREDLAPILAVRCVEDIKICEDYCYQLNPTARNYLLPSLQSIRAYVESYSQFRLSFNVMKSSEYGLAISHLSKGIDILKKRKKLTAPYESSVDYACQYMLSALTDRFNQIDHQNRNSYHQVVPTTPPLPNPYKSPDIGCSSPLLCPANEILKTQNISNSTPNIANMGNQPPNMPANHASYGVAPNSYQQPSIPMPTSAINYPTIAPAQLPSGPQSPKPTNIPKPPQSSTKPSEPLNIKEWEIVCALKNELLPRIKKAMASTNPNISNIARSLILQYQQASQIDPQIQESINKCKMNPSISPDTVNPYIKQADVFYTQLEERLNILERTGR